MKSFEIAIIDDQGLDTGFGRFLALLYKNQYLSSNDFTLVQKKDYSDGLGKNLTKNSITFQIYTHNYGNQGFKKCFCEAFTDFDTRKEEFDIFIFDLNFIEQGNNSFYPLHTKNQCDTSKKFKKGLTLDKVTDSDKSTLIAGLEFYHCLKPSFKPKIIYSAAQETAVLRSSVKLFNSRLYDTFIVDVTAPAEVKSDSNDPFENKVDLSRTFDAIDAYFQSLQIAIINNQSLEKIQTLNTIVKDWNEKVENADEPLIPDNGTNTSPKNCWSLRTLFPKQVNRIELGLDVEENKTKILETIGNLNFPSIYKFLVHDHGNLNGKEYEDVKNEAIVVNRFPAIIDLEFNTTEKVTYEKFSEIVPNQSAYSHKTIRRKIYDINFDVLNQTVYKETSGNLEEKEPLRIVAGLTEDGRISQAVRKMAEYGLYLGDLKLICTIVDSNAKYNFSNVYKKTKEEVSEELPKPKLTISYFSQEVIINISYDSDEEYYTNSKVHIEPVYEGIKKLLENRQDWKIIDQLGPTQIFKILAYRYNTEFEVRVGDLSFSAGRFGISDIQTNDDGNKTYFQFKLPTLIKS